MAQVKIRTQLPGTESKLSENRQEFDFLSHAEPFPIPPVLPLPSLIVDRETAFPLLLRYSCSLRLDSEAY